MVPNEWNIATLGEHVSISSGYSPSKYNLGIKGPYPFVKVEDMNNCVKYQQFSRNYTELNGSPISQGAVIFPKRGAAIMNNKVRITATQMYLDTNMMSLMPQESLCSEFLYYTLVKEELHRIADTSTIPQINNKHILPYRFKLPPLLEQRKIAKILSTWDKAISTTERLIDNSKQQKKALMQQLLTGKKRLLDDSGKPFEGEWEEVKLSHFFERVMEKNNGQSKNVVTISAQRGLIRQEEFFKKSVASETLDNYFILRKGQFAYNKSYSNGYPMGAIKRLNRYDDAVVTSLYICFELKDEQLASSCFMEQFFESGLLNRRLTKVAAEGGRAHGLLNVKPADFMALSMAVPKINEQQKIASVLTNADQEIELLEQQLADLKQEKKALMQQLLTGKRRVKINNKECVA